MFLKYFHTAKWWFANVSTILAYVNFWIFTQYKKLLGLEKYRGPGLSGSLQYTRNHFRIMPSCIDIWKKFNFFLLYEFARHFDNVNFFIMKKMSFSWSSKFKRVKSPFGFFASFRRQTPKVEENAFRTLFGSFWDKFMGTVEVTLYDKMRILTNFFK